MKRKLLCALFVLQVALFGTLVFAQVVAETDGDELIEATLAAVSQAERISSDFVQERHLSMLKKDIIVKGRFYYEKPDRLRWEQREPVVGGFIVNGSTIRRWGEDGKVETARLGSDPLFGLFVNQVFAWCKGDADWLKKRYAIKVIDRNPPVLRLTPLMKGEKRFLERLSVTFSEDLSSVERVEIQTKDKDSISTTFVNTSINRPLPEGIFN